MAILLELNKRIEKIEAELLSFKIDVSKLNQNEDEGLLRELGDSSDEDNDVDELEDSDDGRSYKKTNARKVNKMPTMEQRKEVINNRSSQYVADISNEDPDELLDKRLKEYINAIEYLKKNNLSKDQKAVLSILDKAEFVKKLQKKGEVDLYDIPAAITPEDLLGVSNQQRVKKYQTIINIIGKTANNLKIIGSNNFKIFNNTKSKIAKDNYDKAILLFKKQTELKKDLLQLAKNRWQPIPELQKTVENFPSANDGDLDEAEVKIKLAIPETFRKQSKYYFKFKWMEDDLDLHKIKVPNKGEEVEHGYSIDFGHHKKFSALK